MDDFLALFSWHAHCKNQLKIMVTIDTPIANHLVLSATTKDLDLAKIVERFRIFPIASYIFTKMDETDEYVFLFNQLWRYRKPLSYLTTGQKVPEDLVIPSKGRVGNLLLQNLSWS